MVSAQASLPFALAVAAVRGRVGVDEFTDETVADPVVQAMTLTDIVIQATVTALLLALAIQVHKRHHTLDPDQLSALRG